ncbi:MAG: MBL fold metallo-hydrolase [Pseudonocardia sp. SCN 72-86]|nr:MAG: MBL fold metallo-hydrolase [Pseudonocardia sp. SCN 72-86]
MLNVLKIDTPSLGDRCYLVHDGHVALVVDPQRDIDRILTLVEREGVKVTHVAETHLHNDYVTGGLALATATGACYLVNGEDPVQFDRQRVRDGDEIAIGANWLVRVMATPGHTYTHLAYVLVEGGVPVAVFSGGSLLHGSTGRPDLLGPENTDALARHQYASAHRLAAELPDGANVYPTHGFGSFCAATQTETLASTIGDEKQSNAALTEDEEAYVNGLLAGLDEWPAYYVHMEPLNAVGPSIPDFTLPVPADKDTLLERIVGGEWVIDLRHRKAFAAGFVPGTFSFGLDGKFATYVGWLIPRGCPITVLGETPDQVAEAQRELTRIGIDRLEGAATGGPEDWTDGPLGSFQRASFTELDAVRHHRPIAVLDVRRNLERALSHIDGSIHVPLHNLLERMGDVPVREVWIYCNTGYRASIAASILAANGHDVVAVDEDYDSVFATDLPIVESEVPAVG